MKENKNYKWVVVGLLWVVALLNYLDRQMLATMRPSMQMDIHELQSATNFGYLMGIFLWVYGIMSPISGIIADKVNRKWLIVGSLFVGSTFNYAAPLYHDLIDAFNQSDFKSAADFQQQANDMIALLGKYGGIATGKAYMKIVGFDCGGFRLPVRNMSIGSFELFKKEVEQLNFKSYCSTPPSKVKA